jgi:type IV pilus assembly protein PilM
VRFLRSKCLVGLDIGSSAVKAIELAREGRRYRVAAIAVEPVPRDSIVDGAIVDSPAVTDAVRRIFETKRFVGTKVAAALSGSSVIVKAIEVPTMSERELSTSIDWEAEQHIPFDIQDVNLDYVIGGRVKRLPAAAATASMDVLLVAAKKDEIAACTTVITQAGRVPVVLDVDAFALQNAYEANYDVEADQVIVLLNAGASAININIVAGAQSVFARDVSIGGNAFTEAVQKQLALPFAVAEQLKTGRHKDDALAAEARQVLRAMTDSALLEIEKTFDFFKTTAKSEYIDRIVLSGGASRLDGFADALAQRFETTVEHLNPFRQIVFDSMRLGVRAEDLASLSAVAIGLALRREGDR